MGDSQAVIPAFRRYVVLQPAIPNVRYNLEIALGDAEQYTEAIIPVRASPATAPDPLRSQTPIMLPLRLLGAATVIDIKV